MINIIDSVKTVVKSPVITKVVKFTHDNLPAILAGSAAITAAGTLVASVIGTHKADEIIRTEQERRDEELPDYEGRKLDSWDKVKLTWKCYVPTALLFTATEVLIISSNRVGNQRYLAAMGALKLSEAAFEDYKSSAADILGADKAKEVQNEADKKTVNAVDEEQYDKIAKSGGPGQTMFYDRYTGNYFMSTAEDIKAAARTINQMLAMGRSDSSVRYKEFYKELGVAYGAEFLDQFGWGKAQFFVIDEASHLDCVWNTLDVDFNPAFVNDDPNRPCTTFDFNVEPTVDPGNDVQYKSPWED